MPGQWNDLTVVGAALDNHVDLDRRQADLVRDFDTLEHVKDRKINIVHAAKNVVVQGVKADRDTLQPGVFQHLRFFDQQRAVGGQGDVERPAGRCLQPGQHANQHFKVFAQQWLPAG